MAAESTDGMESLYQAAVGPKKADFYVPIFLRFDQPGASKASWNWPAFLVSFYWFLYRRMFGYWAIYCLLIPMGLGIAGVIIGRLVGGPLGQALNFLLTLGYSLVWIPIYANSLYYQAINKRLAELSRKVPDRATQVVVLANGPVTSQLVWVVIPFIFVAIIGILAAIAIPAYQAYTIRAQVTEGLVLASPFKAAVSEALAETKDPDSLTASALRLSMPGGAKYVTDMQIVRGAVMITYGGGANSQIGGKVLVLTPGTTSDGNVVWICGTALAPPGVQLTVSDAQRLTTIAPQYLPSKCHAGGP